MSEAAPTQPIHIKTASYTHPNIQQDLMVATTLRFFVRIDGPFCSEFHQLCADEWFGECALTEEFHLNYRKRPKPFRLQYGII